tara:strand:+ start:191 stop:739 length:549 start_codon:yes stop_codon:yes gene_type:complete
MNKLSKLIFLDVETVSNQTDYWSNIENQNDLIQISFIDLFDNETDIILRPYKTYHETDNWYADHRLTWDIVKDMHELPNYYLELKDKLEGNTIIAHNMNFDRNVIYQSLKNYGLNMFQNINWVDSKQIYADYFGVKNKSYTKLERLAKQIGVYDENAHNGLVDAKMLRSVFMNMVRQNIIEI